ncbi:MAG TPA: HlyD family type I secretion periplasmic adaptor subunit [Hyphomicrobiaceae bacterium]|nr:HlyD family type I secretion periplasmic adaptor subunit [Hyphomicrobiaceae bacterium]
MTVEQNDNRLSVDAGHGKPPGEKADKRFSVFGRVMFGAGVIALLVAGVGGWAATAQLSGAVIAQGTVVVDKNVKKIQHRDGGIVAKIHVKNGDQVTAGQPIIELDDTQIRAELGVVRSQLAELSARKVRLTAEATGVDRIVFPEAFLKSSEHARLIAAGESNLFHKVRANVKSQQEQLRLQISQLKEEIDGIEAQRSAKGGQLGLIDKELAQIQGLYDKKLTSITRLYTIQREQQRLRGEHGGLLAQIARAKGKISEIEVQLLSAEQNASLQAQRELRNTEGKLSELRERELATADRLTRTKLLAPQSGTVHDLAVHTIGGIISPAATVVMIVPSNEQLTVEAKFSPVDIDQILIGRETRMRFSAFNQRTTPEVNGNIVHVAADVVSDPKTAQNYYVARISITPASLAKLKGLTLVPGMPVEVFAQTGARTALSYLAKPITDQFNRAFREQ